MAEIVLDGVTTSYADGALEDAAAIDAYARIGAPVFGVDGPGAARVPAHGQLFDPRAGAHLSLPGAGS
jgi:hypothetical protein